MDITYNIRRLNFVAETIEFHNVSDMLRVKDLVLSDSAETEMQLIELWFWKGIGWHSVSVKILVIALADNFLKQCVLAAVADLIKSV